MTGKLSSYFSKTEQKLLDNLNTPEKIQNFIDSKIKYDPIREDRSVKDVLEERKAECYNGALFATACLLNQKVKASIVEILARRDEEHVLCVYKKGGKYGSIAQSKFLGLKSRNPIYTTVRDLVVSYMEFYFSFDGRLTLASFTNPLSLSKYKLKWLYDRNTVIKMAKDLRASKHSTLVAANDPIYYVSPKRYWREVLVIPKGTKIPQKYLVKGPKK
ncbi:hypothetical protein A2961_03645 [Candidatus Woesebacteria bacterium RIFCSPLOWO2_01_FULL_39_21]|uniref:Transglutaminase-like domain-containing protein n=1 Tax=Candidatus Woesebacteria bacterium RIFCSPLOWO2_01_FULL_39_21 TaxID=1802519 RepID=A0A1F8BBE1_9BACT|nr:MAG: hypothetical protein A2961_03645 [Candidatus Woesebacteria bacterium RIFCSPLOWO2_01_FULL_39_21]